MANNVQEQIDSLKQKLLILEAYQNGECIQTRPHKRFNDSWVEWKDSPIYPNVLSEDFEFRVKPKPKFFIPSPGTRVLRRTIHWGTSELMFVKVCDNDERSRMYIIYSNPKEKGCGVSPVLHSWALGEKIPFDENCDLFGHTTSKIVEVLNPETCDWFDE